MVTELDSQIFDPSLKKKKKKKKTPFDADAAMGAEEGGDAGPAGCDAAEPAAEQIEDGLGDKKDGR